jgi:hypothetical protein
MNTSNFTDSFWTPYKIPPCPTPEAGQFYSLSFNQDATPEKNPSQFLEWKELLPPAPQDDVLYVLTIRDGALAWTATEDCD